MQFRPGATTPRVPGRFIALAAAGSIAWCDPAPCSEVSGAVTLATEYVYRGQALSGHNPAIQAGIDYQHDSGFFLGAWASTVDLPNPTGRRDGELDFYAGYQFLSDARWSATLALTRYTYPGQTGPIDYDYTEALAVLTYDTRYSIEFGYTNDLYGFGVPGRHAELRADWPLRNAVIVSAGLGYNDTGEISKSGYGYWDLGASARVSRLSMDLRWYNNNAAGGYLRSMSAGSRTVLSLSLAF